MTRYFPFLNLPDTRIPPRSIFLLLPLLALACQEDSPTGPSRLARGVWGGEETALTVTRSGGRLAQNCAEGSLEQPLLLDAAGHFEATGTYTVTGPVAILYRQALYSGTVEGDLMTLTVFVPETNTRIGPLQLLSGRQTQVPPCLLICRPGCPHRLLIRRRASRGLAWPPL